MPRNLLGAMLEDVRGVTWGDLFTLVFLFFWAGLALKGYWVAFGIVTALVLLRYYLKRKSIL